ncbi:hypothetical protein ACO2Q9_18025 [Variovorax sp. VNK109]|uniref:hypothetical protein n=1 Tax=Variovorax sp. VNK109 TaxID=3400919 RepID=UPI003C0E4D74
MASATTLARLEIWIWVLIYGGLFGVVLGCAVQRFEEPADLTSTVLFVMGGIAAALGFALIYVRSRLKEGP